MIVVAACRAWPRLLLVAAGAAAAGRRRAGRRPPGGSARCRAPWRCDRGGGSVGPVRLVVLAALVAAAAGVGAGWSATRRVAGRPRGRHGPGAGGLRAARRRARPPASRPGRALDRAAADWPPLAPVAEAFRVGADVPDGAPRLAATARARATCGSSRPPGRSRTAPAHGLADAVDRVARGPARRARPPGGSSTGELASARATARLVAGLPVLALAMGSGAGGDPWGFLLGHPVGLACLAAGLGVRARRPVVDRGDRPRRATGPRDRLARGRCAAAVRRRLLGPPRPRLRGPPRRPVRGPRAGRAGCGGTGCCGACSPARAPPSFVGGAAGLVAGRRSSRWRDLGGHRPGRAARGAPASARRSAATCRTWSTLLGRRAARRGRAGRRRSALVCQALPGPGGRPAGAASRPGSPSGWTRRRSGRPSPTTRRWRRSGARWPGRTRPGRRWSRRSSGSPTTSPAGPAPTSRTGPAPSA